MSKPPRMSGGSRTDGGGGTRDAAWAGFAWSRERYEDLISRVVPDYEAQESLIVEAVRAGLPGDAAPFDLLELGAGTGGLARRLLQTFPHARLTAMDVSAVMLSACRDALASFGERARVVEGDFADDDLGSGLRAVISRLAVHHLSDEQKRALFARVFSSLAPGGVFVNSDLIRGGGEAEEAAMQAEWRAYMVARGDDPDEWVRWLVGEDDHPAVLEEQIAWLEATGFCAVSTVWRRAGFAMVQASKPV